MFIILNLNYLKTTNWYVQNQTIDAWGVHAVDASPFAEW